MFVQKTFNSLTESQIPSSPEALCKDEVISKISTVPSQRASIRKMNQQLMAFWPANPKKITPKVSPSFEIAKIEAQQIGSRYNYILYTKDGQWIQFNLKENDKIRSQISIGNKVTFLEITEQKLKYGEKGFYLRYNIAFKNGSQIHVDGQIRQPSNLKTRPQSVTNVVSEAVTSVVFNGAKYVTQVHGININIILEDGSQYFLKSDVHAWFDTSKTPSPIQKGDLAYVFDNTLVVVDANGIARELPLYKS